MRRPRLCLASADSEALGVAVRAHYGALPLRWLDGDRQRWGNPSCRKAAKSPEERSLSHKSRDGASERRFCYYQGASFGAPSPLKEGRKTKSPTRAAARGRWRLAV